MFLLTLVLAVAALFWKSIAPLVPSLDGVLTNAATSKVTWFAIGFAFACLILARRGILDGFRGNPEDIAVRFPTTDWAQPLASVFKLSYRNRAVRLDGREFIECVFDNATII